MYYADETQIRLKNTHIYYILLKSSIVMLVSLFNLL